MCYGLRTDFQGKLFSGSRALLAIADDLREVRTICRCGRKATMVVRLGADGKVARQGEQVAIGKDVYVSLCRRHWEEGNGPRRARRFHRLHQGLSSAVGDAADLPPCGPLRGRSGAASAFRQSPAVEGRPMGSGFV